MHTVIVTRFFRSHWIAACQIFINSFWIATCQIFYVYSVDNLLHPSFGTCICLFESSAGSFPEAKANGKGSAVIERRALHKSIYIIGDQSICARENPPAATLCIFSETLTSLVSLLYKPTPPRSSVYQGFDNLPTTKMRKANVCVYVCFLLVLIAALEWQVVLSTDQVISGSGDTPVQQKPPLIDCKGECDRRCKVAPRKKGCLKFCAICCDACKCVPSGTKGNKDECPCYRDKKSRQGKSKCP